MASFLYQQVKVTPLDWNERYYLPQETGNYSVAGFKLNMERKMTHYVITYYLPSGLFVVVSWASFLIPSDDIQVNKFKYTTLSRIPKETCAFRAQDVFKGRNVSYF